MSNLYIDSLILKHGVQECFEVRLQAAGWNLSPRELCPKPYNGVYDFQNTETKMIIEGLLGNLIASAPNNFSPKSLL